MNGIVIIDKPAGWTSQDVTVRLRRVFGTRRIGHGGTLDPMATGVLPVFVGRATRAVEFFEHAQKEYEALLVPGLTTDTEDTTGTVLTHQEVSVTKEQLEAVLPKFRGEILQVPPMYSALKVNGQKLYDLARKGKEVPREPRPVTISELTFLGFEEGNVLLQVACSKGTYIRTLCKDIGEALGCGGCMGRLRRTRAGAYTLADAVPLEALLEAEHPEKYLRPVDSLFSDHPAVKLTANQEKRCRNGNAFSVRLAPGTYRAYSQNGEFLMLAQVREGTMQTVKSFFEPESIT
ncbi:MAG: tRNA pseudouridine(55) synthase TruB [Faecousia sp.]